MIAAQLSLVLNVQWFYLKTFYLSCLVCGDSLGLEHGKMSMKDSASYSNHEGTKGRLNNLGWSPQWEDHLATLKINFGLERRKITAVAVQSKEGHFVSAYELVYSEDGLSWRHWVVNAHELVGNLFHSLKVVEMTFNVWEKSLCTWTAKK